MKKILAIFQFVSIFLITFFSVSSIGRCQDGQIDITSYFFSLDALHPDEIGSADNPGFLNNHTVKNSRDEETVYKHLVKKKVKVKFRARYCYLRLAPVVFNNNFFFPLVRLKFNYSESFFYDQLTDSRQLRGPPALVA